MAPLSLDDTIIHTDFFELERASAAVAKSHLRKEQIREPPGRRTALN
jgi:hypothetical protein